MSNKAQKLLRALYKDRPLFRSIVDGQLRSIVDGRRSLESSTQFFVDLLQGLYNVDADDLRGFLEAQLGWKTEGGE